jgi:hypothetical protein
MMSEWMKVMLEEISRKKSEAAQARVEEQPRHDERERRDEREHRDEPVAPPRSGTDRARG